MSTPNETLPEFFAPPVIEVALGVQFSPPIPFKAAHVGRLWAEYADQFPRTEDQPPVTSVVEVPEGQTAPLPSFRFVGTPPLPRCWFLNEAQTDLIQIQNDKFIRNWRKVTGQEDYPRYEYIRETFVRDYAVLERFVASEQLGELHPTQCEVTYVNHILPSEAWQRHGQLDRVLSLLRNDVRAEFLPEAEDVRCTIRYVIKDDSGAFLGRLNADAQPALMTGDRTPLLVLTLTARGRPDGEGLDGVLKFLDRGRKWIVRGFVDLTTDQMQTIWERRS